MLLAERSGASRLALIADARRDRAGVVSLKEAAAAVGWREDRVKRHVIRHARENPDAPRLGWQPGNVPNAPWEIDLPRFLAHVRGG